jgi:hypothetical protein
MNKILGTRNLGVVGTVALVWTFAAGGCSSSSSPETSDSGTPETSTQETGTGSDTSTTDTSSTETGSGTETSTSEASSETGPADTGGPDEGPPDGSIKDTGAEGSKDADAGCTGTELTVIDSQNWCTVTVGSNPSFSSGKKTYCVTTGSSVALSATPIAGFMLGTTNWHLQTGTETDTSTVASTTETPTTATACVWVCCPGASDPCSTTDPCP